MKVLTRCLWSWTFWNFLCSQHIDIYIVLCEPVVPFISSSSWIKFDKRHYPCYTGVRSGIWHILMYPFPKSPPKEFTWAWTQFGLVAAAKEWSTKRQAAILPTLLWGKLVDHYVEHDVTTRTNLKQQKTAHMTKAGLTQDPLTARKMFISRCQCPGEKAYDFAD